MTIQRRSTPCKLKVPADSENHSCGSASPATTASMTGPWIFDHRLRVQRALDYGAKLVRLDAFAYYTSGVIEGAYHYEIFS